MPFIPTPLTTRNRQGRDGRQHAYSDYLVLSVLKAITKLEGKCMLIKCFQEEVKGPEVYDRSINFRARA